MSMNTDRESEGKFNQPAEATEATADAHVRVALEHAAMYSAQLAIARWIKDSAGPHSPVMATTTRSAQARWYEQTQKNFQEWMARGGFSQPEHDDTGAVPAALPDTNARCTDACAVDTP